MQQLALFQLPTNYEEFVKEPLKLLRVCGITTNLEPSLGQELYKIVGFINAAVVLLRVIAYIGFECGTLSDRFGVVSPLSYYIMGVLKTVVMIRYRLDLIKTLEEFKEISPTICDIRQYGLENHFRKYKKVERFLYICFKYIVLVIMIQPIIQSIVVLLLYGEFEYLLPLQLWPDVPPENGYIIYLINYLLVWWSTPFIGHANIGTDLCLISFLSQLGVSFELIAKRILELKPEDEKSLASLNEIIVDHQRILKVAKSVNEIFQASVALNLMSSSFIMCFVAYQMIDEVSAIEAVLAFLVLCYESKQIVFICSYGENLIASSGKVFDAICIQEWNKGSLAYQRQLGFLLMIIRRPVALRIGGVINVSLTTLRQVFSNSYQIFAVLKTKKI